MEWRESDPGQRAQKDQNIFWTASKWFWQKRKLWAKWFPKEFLL